MGSNGQPYDDVDRACLDAYRAYRCMVLDHNHGDLKQVTSRNENGTAIDGCYHGIQFVYHVNHQGEITCGPEHNPGYAQDAWHGCRAAACEIEKNFAYKVLEAVSDPILFQQNNWMNYGEDQLQFFLNITLFSSVSVQAFLERSFYQLWIESGPYSTARS